MFNISDPARNAYMLSGPLAYEGYDWWWHSFTGYHQETGKERQFFVAYFLVNPALGGRRPILGQDPVNQQKRRRPSYLMVKAGMWGENAMQLHRFYAWDQVSIHQQPPFHICAGACYASDDHIMGRISLSPEEAKAHPEYMSDAGSMSWDLKVDKKIAFNVGYGASTPMRDANAFEMYWHAEGMKTAFSGQVIVNGEVYAVAPSLSYGYSDKNWGKGFTSPWVWLSSNSLVSNMTGKRLNNSVFDIGGGRPKVGPVELDRKLLGAFYYEGKEYEFNFSKFWTMPGTKFACRETDKEIVWKVWQENLTSLVKVDVRCKKKDMLLIQYEDPRGHKDHTRLWNGGNGMGRIQLFDKYPGGLILVDDICATRIGCEYGEFGK